MSPAKKPSKAGTSREARRRNKQVTTAKKTTDRKKAAKAPAKKEPQKATRARPAKAEPAPTVAAPPERVAPRRKAPPKPPPSPAAEILPRRAPIAAAVAGSKLGAKWECFSCGAKFYDLGKDTPLCPKCGANQRNRPRTESRPKPVVGEPPAPRPERPIQIVEEDEEERDVVMDEDGLEIGIGPVDEEDFVGEEEEIEEEEEEPEAEG
jgi:uncharacterized protein (TIGR02300 family)